MKTEEKISRGQHAERLLKDSLLDEALSAIKGACFDEIENNGKYDEDELKNIFYILKAQKLFESALRGYLVEGKLTAQSFAVENIKGIKR